MMVALGSVLGLTQTANAATPGITANLLLDGATYDGTAVVGEGQTLTLRVQYTNEVTPGSTVEFDFDSNVSLSGVPGGNNAAIDTVTQDGNKVAIKFKDPWPAGINQGVFDLNVTMNQVEESALTAVT